MATGKKSAAVRKKGTRSLVIVESPAKASTIRKYLGNSFDVKASVGHIRDLPKSKLGVDVENGFKPHYITIKGKAGVIKELKAAAKKADVVYLAPDPDREGEAIAQHILDVIQCPEKAYRIMFNEITKKAVQSAIDNPHSIDTNRVMAQQARRTLDRLVGYKLSPLLWNKVRSGLSAGRVQSVAMRILLNREMEIEAFEPKEYWSIACRLSQSNAPDATSFEARLYQIDGEKFEISNGGDASTHVENIRKESLAVDSVTVKDKKRNPVAPFITSTLQQVASQRFRYSASRTMSIAQKLYEGMEVGDGEAVGLITYMRTDSTRIANEAVDEVRAYIGGKIGKDYLPETPNEYKSKKSAQEGHEAIRPTSVERTPESLKKHLKPEEFKLYDLIWKRFVASQMNPAITTIRTVDVKAGRYTIRATGSHIKFDGFLKIYMEDDENGKEPENIIPPLENGDPLNLAEITPNQHFTQPPPRYTEASLIKELEEKGIGRPSTYASIMNVIRNRDYAELIERKLHPTKLGRTITEALTKYFPDILDIQFTANMEENLDNVETGKKDWTTLLGEFYGPFMNDLNTAEKEMKSLKVEEQTDEVCEKCGSPMVIKHGRFGRFMACSSYPECRNTKQVGKNGEAAEPEKIDEKCPNCGSDMVVKAGRFGKFIACSRYPECKTTKPMSLGITCPKKCGGDLVERRSKRGRVFYGCSNYPKCDFTSWEKPQPGECPKCGNPYLVYAKGKSGDGETLKCPNKECDFTKEIPRGEEEE